MAHTVKITVRLDGSQQQSLNALAERLGQKPSAVVREAIAQLIIASSKGTPTELRRQLSSEFVFLAMRRWAEKNLPDETGELLAEARRRTEALYAPV